MFAKLFLPIAAVGATAFALDSSDIVGTLTQLADGIGEGFVALTLGFSAMPAGLGFLIGGIMMLSLGSFVPVSFEVESLTVVSRLANRDWKKMAQIVVLAGFIGFLLGVIGVYSNLVDFIQGTVLAGMLTGVGVILCFVAFDLFKQNMILGGVSVVTAVLVYLPLSSNDNGLVYALGASVGAALVAAVILSRFRPFEPLEVDTSRERLQLLPFDRFRFLTDTVVIRGALALLALRTGTSIAYSSIDGELANHAVNVDHTNITAGLAGMASGAFGGPPIEPIISGTAPAHHAMSAGALMMFVMAALLLLKLLPKMAVYVPASVISGFLFLLGAFAAFSSNVGGIVSDDNPYAGPVTAVVTAGTFDPFLGMVAGIVVRFLTGQLV